MPTFTDDPRLTDVNGESGYWPVPPFASEVRLLSDQAIDPSLPPPVVILRWSTNNPLVAPNIIARQLMAPWYQYFPPAFGDEAAAWLTFKLKEELAGLGLVFG